MQALNFLYETPTVNWFDFVVRPETLQDHLNTAKPDPTIDQLLCEFCEQAWAEEELVNKYRAIDDEEADFHKSKATTLWSLAFYIAGHLQWNLSHIRKLLGLVKSRDLVIACLRLNYGPELPNLEMLDLTELHTVPAYVQFAVVLYCRWHVQCAVYESLPRIPPKSTVSNVASMIDPSVILMEKRAQVLEEVMRNVPHAVQILEKLCTCPLSSYSIPAPACIELMLHGPVANHDWTKMLSLPVDDLVRQLHYDLGVYWFFTREYSKARTHLVEVTDKISAMEVEGESRHFCLDSAVLAGFSAALQLERSDECSRKGIAAPQAVLAEAEADAAEDVDAVLSGDRARNMLTSCSYHRFEEKQLARNQPQCSKKLHAYRLVRSVIRGGRIGRMSRRRLSDPGGSDAFIEELQLIWHSLSMEQRRSVKQYLRYLCLRLGGSILQQTLKQCVFAEFCDLKKDDVNRISDLASKCSFVCSKLSEVYRPGIHTGHGFKWQLLTGYDPTEIKNVATKFQGHCISAHWYVPDNIQQLLTRIPPGPLQDIVAAIGSKAQQLATLGALDEAGNLLGWIETEVRSAGLIFGNYVDILPRALHRESLTFGLKRWHGLSPLNTNTAEIGMFTQQLATRVKSLISEAGSSSNPAGQPYQDLVMFCCAFLLNTCDWEYIMMHCKNVTNRSVDFSILLAALCYEVNKDGDNVNLLSQEFFDLLIPTMVDTTQIKRGHGGGPSQTIHRESHKQLLNRFQLGTIVKYMKDPLSISLLLSFLGKLYNCIDPTTGIVIHTDYGELWPTSYTEATGVNGYFLNDMIGQLLQNAVTVNPINPSWLQTTADFAFAHGHYAKAMKYYLQTIMITTQMLTKRIQCTASANEVGMCDSMVRNMMKSASYMKAHTQEALLCQFLTNPDYTLALKAFEEKLVFDAQTDYYCCIWDIDLMEFLIYSLNKRNEQGKVQEAIAAISIQELNSNNDPSVVRLAQEVRKRRFLMALINEYC